MTAAPPRRALITGARGQLGLELQGTAPAGWVVLACGTGELDVTRQEMVREVLHRHRPELVIQAAAFTQVDGAEADPAAAEAVNVEGAANVARAAGEIGARMLHVSTDYVFDGSRGSPYLPTDAPNPLGVYGRTKLAGEREVGRILGDRAVIVRSAWLYSGQRQNFVRTMLRLMQEKPEIAVVSDQVGTPTWARSLARALWQLAERPALAGVHHWTDAGVASWYDFAVAIQEEGCLAGVLTRAVPVRAVRSSEFRTAARRPPFSVLDTGDTRAALGATAPHWRTNLRLMLLELARG